MRGGSISRVQRASRIRSPLAPKGALWFTELYGNRIGRIPNAPAAPTQTATVPAATPTVDAAGRARRRRRSCRSLRPRCSPSSCPAWGRGALPDPAELKATALILLIRKG